MERIFYLYSLIRSDNWEPLYVGKGCKKRIKYHRYMASRDKHSNLYLQRTVKKLWRNGLDFSENILLENLTERQALDLEQSTIAHYKDLGYTLCNLSNGGDGPGSCSDESKKKMSLARKGKKLNKEHKSAISRGLRNSVVSGNIYRKLSVSDVKQIYNLLLNTNKTLQQIAHSINNNLHWNAISHINSGTNWAHLANDLEITIPIRPLKKHQPSFSNGKKGEIYKELLTGRSRIEIAKEFKCSLRTVYRIQKEKRNG